MGKESNLFIIVWTVICAWQGPMMTGRWLSLPAKHLTVDGRSKGHIVQYRLPLQHVCAPLKILNIMFCSCCSCVPPWLVVWATIISIRDIYIYFISPSCTTHVFFVKFQPRLSRFILLKMKTLFNALELDYCTDIELSTEICVDAILERTFPLSTEHISCISKPARRLKYNY